MTSGQLQQEKNPLETSGIYVTQAGLDEALKEYVSKELCTERTSGCQKLQVERLGRIDDKTTLQTKLMWALLILMGTSILTSVLQAIGLIK